jgi:putative transposase
MEQIRRAATDEPFDIVAYCFMPDHVHLLVAGRTESADLKRFVSRARQFAGYHFKQRFGRNLWQRYGYERVLRTEEATTAVIRYIVENPLRAGRVGKIDEYPYFGSDICDREALFDVIRDASVLARGWCR